MYTCQICSKNLQYTMSLTCHLKKVHNFSRQQYYDTYFKKEGDGICAHPNCEKLTKFLGDRYAVHCSYKCCNSNPEYILKRENKKGPEVRKRATEKRNLTLKNNPEIMKKMGEKLKNTYKENPEIMKKLSEKLKKIYKEKPEIRKKMSESRRKTFESNPEIMKKTVEKIKKKFKENPEIMKNAMIKRNETLKENPEIIKNISKKRSQTIKNNPEIMKNAMEKRKKTLEMNPEIDRIRIANRKNTLRENPDILRNAFKKRSEKYKNNPEIMKNAMIKRNETYKNNPDIIKNSWTPERRKASSLKAIRQIEDNSNFGNYGRNGRVSLFHYKDIKMRSSWEVTFAKMLDERNIMWEYEKSRFLYNETHHYIPDFYLSEYDIYVDVKPEHFKEGSLNKINAVIDKHMIVVILLDESEFDIFFEDIDKFVKTYYDPKTE